MIEEQTKVPSIDAVIGAVLDRLDGLPFKEVMTEYHMTPNQFYKAIHNGKLTLSIGASKGDVKNILSEVEVNDEMRRELFRMDEDLLKEQYENVLHDKEGKGQYRFHYGTLTHPHNVDSLVYIALSTNNPLLGSEDRDEVIDGFSSLPKDLANYLRTIRLGGILKNAFGSSTHRALDSYDSMYQERTGDKSLFDLKYHPHLHRWGFLGSDFKSSQAYWNDKANVILAVYHTLTETYPKLGSENREEVISVIEDMSLRMQERLYSLGLNGLMNSVFMEGEKGSPIAVMRRFDTAYQDKTGDKSLFDLSIIPHIHPWSLLSRAPMNYWKDMKNAEEAIFHVLSEDRPNLASYDHMTAKKAFDSLPKGLTVYLHQMGLGGLMATLRGKTQDSPYSMLKVFDDVYMRKTGNKSLLER